MHHHPALHPTSADLRRVVADVGVLCAVESLVAGRLGCDGDPIDIAPRSVSGCAQPGGAGAPTSPDGWAYDPAAADLHQCGLNMLAVLAARHLLAPGVVTASVIGSGTALELQLVAIRAHVPDVSHVAVATVAGPPPDRVVLDLLDRDGIEVSLVPTSADAVFGATLVVLTQPTRPDELGTSRLAKGTVLVNATGVPLPTALRTNAHALYVDDPGMLTADTRADDQELVDSRPCEHRLRGHRPPLTPEDLRRVVAGAQRGRTDYDHVLLAELTGRVPGLAQAIAEQVRRASAVLGLGDPSAARHAPGPDHPAPGNPTSPHPTSPHLTTPYLTSHA
ncbi:MAG: hypothetical protein ACRC35_13555 [Angustibacter sp.]